MFDVADAGNNTVRSQGIPPTIVAQPQSQTNLAGTIAVFNVSAHGSMPFTYTWQYNGTNFPEFEQRQPDGQQRRQLQGDCGATWRGR